MKSTVKQAYDLPAIGPEDLDISRLSRRSPAGEEAGVRPRNSAARRLAVELHRANLVMVDDAMCFRLKMALLRALRRCSKSMLIEVDDSEGPPPDEASFSIRLDPPEAGFESQLEAVISRVVRSRRWRHA
jgi:hypothetical protein